MSDYIELKRLAEAHAQKDAANPIESKRVMLVEPTTVLALIAENDSSRKHWQNESNNVQALMVEVARLKAENAGLQTGYEAYEQVVQGLKAEVEALRREREGKVLCDLELFETLRDSANTEADEHRQCMATYRPLRQASLDSVVHKCDDLLAAMSKGEQS
ncbi:hypothetical protein [Pseudomonas iridis]|uniref:hypothetical protein n=1 Tax=Pseudomonas iridis TaxID=2710587 RepID=UPI001B33B94C|nr:hypothetical protein [Pseudomonas iridis]MBP5968705.1 hypothetical protein [Pseudomonas iridis]